MKASSIRLHPLLSLLLALTIAISSLAAVPQPRRVSDSTRASAPAAAPLFPDCSGSGPADPTCTSLQVFLLIDDSGSMLYTDPTNQRLDGVKNVLDILAREYYLPAVDAKSNDPDVRLPDIQVALVHFSSEMLHNSGWKTINPAGLSEWNTQLKDFDADLLVNVDYSRPQNTDFLPAFQAVEALAAGQPQAPACPRLVMLFTDGMPDYGNGPLDGEALTKYMQELQGNIQRTFKRSNDSFFVTTMLWNTSPGSPWNKIYRPKWEEISKDDPTFDPRRVLNVATRELAARMERIIGQNIGDPVSTLSPMAGQPQQYTTEITNTLPVESLRLTYYTINTAASFTVTGPDGKGYRPSGENTSIQVLEIYNPAPGAYQISTTALGGMLTRLLRFGKISAQLSPPASSLQQFANAQIGIQLIGADGQALPIPPQVSLQAAVTQLAGSKPLALTPGSAAFTTSWMPIASDSASVDACVTMLDEKGRQVVLYNGPAGVISIDPVTVQAGQASPACLLTDKDISVPLQLVNANNQQPARMDVPVKWNSSVGKQFSSSIAGIDSAAGQYALHFRPSSAGELQSRVTASAVIAGATVPFYTGDIRTAGLQAPRRLALTLQEPGRLGDKLSARLYRWFHPGCIDDSTQIVIGRRFFDVLGPTYIEINGRFTDIDTNLNQAGIERFAVQLVSPDGGASSQKLSGWAGPETGLDASTLVFRSPGLGLYNVAVTDQAAGPACSVLAGLPAQSVLLINDFWEYAFSLILILLLVLLVVFLVRRLRNRRFGRELPLVVPAIVLIVVDAFLVNTLVAHTFKCEFNCAHLAGPNFGVLCTGLETGGFHILGPVRFWGVHILPSIDFPSFSILPALGKVVDPLLEVLRKFVVWNILLAFVALSLGVAFIASRINRFIETLRSAAGRTRILTNLSIWLAFFVIFCTLFYFGPGH